jgi:tetratricopeptide (TPR) repeat protein
MAKGILYFYKGDYNEAVRCWELALLICRFYDAGGTIEVLQLLLNITLGLARLGKKTDYVRSHLKEAEWLIERLCPENDPVRGEFLCNSAELAANDGRLNEAIRLAKQAKAIHERAENHVGAIHTLCVLSLLEEETGSNSSSLALLKEAESLLPEAQHTYYSALVSLRLGEILTKTGDYRAALNSFVKAKKIIGHELFDELLIKIKNNLQKIPTNGGEVK